MEYLPEIELHITHSQSCVIRTLSIMNFVGASENITFIFSCLICILEWVLC
jgi:hypothetical protein